MALLALVISLPTEAFAAPKKQTIEQLVKRLSEAYLAKDLGRLDAERPYQGQVRIVIEHSLSEDDYDIKRVKTLKQAERWLKSLEDEDGTPIREVRPLLRCRKGSCTYNFDGGISHNHLYLNKIIYGYRNGSWYIKTIHLLDGD